MISCSIYLWASFHEEHERSSMGQLLQSRKENEGAQRRVGGVDPNIQCMHIRSPYAYLPYSTYVCTRIRVYMRNMRTCASASQVCEARSPTSPQGAGALGALAPGHHSPSSPVQPGGRMTTHKIKACHKANISKWLSIRLNAP